MRAFQWASDQVWAIEEPALEQIADIAARVHEENWEAVAVRQAERKDKLGVLETRDDVAVVNVIGPLFRRGNLFTDISGATSIETVAQAFQSAVDDQAIRAIVLNVDSPGGEVAGISEFADAIFAAREQKPVVSYVDDLAASGGYWLAAAAEHIVSTDTGRVGSIGVIAKIVERDEPKGRTTHQFISSQSPHKRVDLSTADGQEKVQALVDETADVFVGKIARYRGVSEETVLSEFGQGWTRIAADAQEVGMIDRIGSLESTIEQLLEDSGGFAATNEGGSLMSTKAAETNAETSYTQAQLDAQIDKERKAADGRMKTAREEARADGVKVERERVSAILDSEEAKTRPALARQLASDDISAEAALRIMKAAAEEKPTTGGLSSTMEGTNPDVKPAGEKEQTTQEMINETLRLSGDLRKEGVN